MVKALETGASSGVAPDPFSIIAEPSRRRILDRLRTGEQTVGELLEALPLTQSNLSRHLRVLREARLVTRRVSAQRRVYRLEADGLRQVALWLEPYRALWIHHLDLLERYLDAQEEG